jgi:intraflagellar transport protein 88
MGQLEDALQAFKKLHRIVPREPLVVFHIANLFDLLDDAASATEWFKIVEGAVHTDPRVLMRLGALYLKQKDENQAYQSYAESYQLYPVNMEVLSWLGVWFVRNELFENAIPFFERAAEIEPKELKWRLMVASCYRRLGALQQALDIYREVHSLDPDNVECLTFLCSLTKDANPAEHERFAALLIQAQQRAAQAQREQALSRESARTPVPDPAAGAATDDAAASSPTPPPALAQQQQQQQQHAPSLQRASSSAPRSPAAELDPRFRERVSAEREAQGIRLQRPADGGKTGDEFNDVDVNDMLPLS